MSHLRPGGGKTPPYFAQTVTSKASCRMLTSGSVVMVISYLGRTVGQTHGGGQRSGREGAGRRGGPRPTVFLHLEPALRPFSVRLHPDLVRAFGSFGAQPVGELQDFTVRRLVEPLRDPDPVGILLGDKIDP